MWPEDAKRAGAAVVATEGSDYPNQVNNSLLFLQSSGDVWMLEPGQYLIQWS